MRNDEKIFFIFSYFISTKFQQNNFNLNTDIYTMEGEKSSTTMLWQDI